MRYKMTGNVPFTCTGKGNYEYSQKDEWTFINFRAILILLTQLLFHSDTFLPPQLLNHLKSKGINADIYRTSKGRHITGIIFNMNVFFK